MPVPNEYQRATDDFYHFLLDARETGGLTTTHQTYTMVQGVLQVFRRRLELKEAVLFANVLPALLRALFVADWNPDEPKEVVWDRESMTREVRQLRSGHNFSPDNAIVNVAESLRRHVDQTAFEQALAKLPQEAREFWNARA